MGLKFGLSHRCELHHAGKSELGHSVKYELSLVSAEALLDGETHRSPLASVSTRARH